MTGALKNIIFQKIYKFIVNEKIRNKHREKILILNKQNIFFDENNSVKFLNNTDYLKNKRSVVINPGGYYGFYLMGICMYIKEHYDTKNLLFFGASAGSCCSLLMSIKNDSTKFIDLIVNNEKYKNKNAREMLQEMKKIILENFCENDFDLDRVFITVNTINQTNIYTDFDDLVDVLECCDASSHIPYITGPINMKYKNKFVFDGGFFKDHYFEETKPILFIDPNIWGQNANLPFILYETNPLDFEELYKRGYQETETFGKETLDKILEPLKTQP